jgi:Leucine-rich repeat (LRR) protein
MATHQSIETLHRSGHSNREIAHLLSIDRGAVNKHVRQLRAESRALKESASGCDEVQNRPNAPTGSDQKDDEKTRKLVHFSSKPWPVLKRPLTEEEKARAAIEALGGKIQNDTDFSLYGTKVTDEDLVHLKALPRLRNLDLRGTQITDAGLEHIKGLARLTGLDLQATQISDARLWRALNRVI